MIENGDAIAIGRTTIGGIGIANVIANVIEIEIAIVMKNAIVNEVVIIMMRCVKFELEIMEADNN